MTGGWDQGLLALAQAMEASLRGLGIDPFAHDDAEVEAMLEREHDWLGDDG